MATGTGAETFSELVEFAMRTAGVLGVGQTPLAQDMDDAFAAFRYMMKQWQRRRWLVYALDDVEVPLTPHKRDYTIGASGHADITTSTHVGTIESVYLRQYTGWGSPPSSFPVDYPIKILPSKQAWHRIALKFLGSWPTHIYYDPHKQDGTLHVWPVPIQHFFALHLSYATDIMAGFFEDENIQTVQPAEAQEAMLYNLAARLRANYGLQPKPDIVAFAQSSLNTLRTTNFANNIGTLRMPAGLGRSSRWKNPMAGHIPDANAGIPFPVLGP